MNKSWKKLDSRIAYRNKWTTILEDKVIIPTGSESVYAYISRQAAYGVWPIFEKNGEKYTYLVSQFRYPVQERLLQVILEGGEDGEEGNNKDAQKAAVNRALREELGIKAEKITFIGNAYTDPGLNTESMQYFIAEDLKTIGKADKEDTELDLEVHEYPVSQLDKLVKDGRIKDQHTITAIYLLQKYLTH